MPLNRDLRDLFVGITVLGIVWVAVMVMHVIGWL